MREFPLFRLIRWSLLLVPLACNSPAAFAEALAPSTPTTKADPSFHVDLRKAVGYLASDELEGRGVGTPGLDKAADYIADAFKKLGLQTTPGMDGYFQPFAITNSVAADPASSLALNGNKYAKEKDFSVVSFSAEDSFDAPVAFAGYGITNKKAGYDDYASIDAKGKVVLALRYEPHDANGISRFTKKKDDWSEHASLIAKAKNAAKHGAVALLLVNPPKFHEDTPIPFSRDTMDETASIPFLQVKRNVAEDILGGEKLDVVQAKIDADGKPVAMELPKAKASGKVKILRKKVPVKNVVAMLPGKGELADEYVVIGAHYDHLGHGGPNSLAINSHEIHNGADDNASGTSAMLELAEHYAKTGVNGRSMIFIAFTGEEEGLLGSKRFVSEPPVPLEKMAYMINFDMVGRVRNNVISVGGTGTAPSFDAILKKADDASPLEMKNFGKGGFGPSDHMSFALKKIPVLFLWTGTHGDYHRPTDDADKINYAGMEQVIQFSIGIIDALDAHAREQYVATFDHSSISFGGSPGGSRVTLGVVPDYGTDDVKGVKISGTVPGSPAEAAGMQDGDILIKFGDTKIDSLYGLTDVLRAGHPGDKVKLIVIRNGKNLELNATLAERKG